MKLIRETSKTEEDRGGYTRKVLLEHVFKQKDAINSVWTALVTIPPSGLAQAHFHENVTEIFYNVSARKPPNLLGEVRSACFHWFHFHSSVSQFK